MKRFIISVILGGIAAVILNYLDFIKLPEPSFVIGMVRGDSVNILATNTFNFKFDLCAFVDLLSRYGCLLK